VGHWGRKKVMFFPSESRGIIFVYSIDGLYFNDSGVYDLSKKINEMTGYGEINQYRGGCNEK
jgi:hypothetical protein